MSGPLGIADAPIDPEQSVAEARVVEVTDSREAVVGAMTVRRALPRRHRRTVGAWCFADHVGPQLVTEEHGIDIGPHPHIGLHTVTWLVAGALLHRDSLGSEQLIRPGQLNLMTAGEGIAHAEEATRSYHGTLHGVQLWIAQPEASRHGAAAFQHLPDLPRAEFAGAEATVLVGAFGDAVSPAHTDSPLVGVDLEVRAGATVVPLVTAYEHAMIVLEGAIGVGDEVLRPGQLGYLGIGRDELRLAALEPSRALLLGGAPFAEPIVMWWNFVARSRDEIAEARNDWQSGAERFADVGSSLPRIPAPAVALPR